MPIEFRQVIRGRPVRRGITMPDPDSKCGKAWNVFYDLFNMGHTITGATAVELGNARNLNPGNVRTELSNWRRFNGLR